MRASGTPWRSSSRTVKRIITSGPHTRATVREGSNATGDLTSEVVSAGRELLGEFRHEVSGILDDARKELRELVQDQVKDISKGARRTRRKMGM